MISSSTSQKHKGLFALLDETSRFPTATASSLAEKFHSAHGKSHRTIYIMPRDGGTSFSIKHYAGVVSRLVLYLWQDPLEAI